MCWMCHVREQSIYRKCDGCGKAFNRSNLQEYDIQKEWGQAIEFIEHESRSKRFANFCENCRDAMNAYRESVRQQTAETEPYVWRHYYNRNRDTRFGLVPVGVRSFNQILGIRCAQIKYGIEATEEIMQGFSYRDKDDVFIRRLTLEDIDESVRCDKCWLRLFECNAREVSR